jgi:manganese transport protein
LNLLFGLPLLAGVSIAVLDAVLLLLIINFGIRKMEAFIFSLVFIISASFFVEIFLAKPDPVGILSGFVPAIQNELALYIAIGIIGATVMPHNLYLHSSVVQTRKYEQTAIGKAEAIKFATIDSTLALGTSLFINAAILIVAAATFHSRGHQNVAEIQDAYRLLSPMLGVPLASGIFAIALLCSGQNSTLTGTLAGQIVMEGFLNIRIRPWLRRLITRGIAIIPAVIVASLYGARGTAKLLLLSQVILSLQLSFAVIPLIGFTSERRKMGEFASPLWLKTLAWITAALIVSLNMKYLCDWVGISAWVARFF